MKKYTPKLMQVRNPAKPDWYGFRANLKKETDTEYTVSFYYAEGKWTEDITVPKKSAKWIERKPAEGSGGILVMSPNVYGKHFDKTIKIIKGKKITDMSKVKAKGVVKMSDFSLSALRKAAEEFNNILGEDPNKDYLYKPEKKGKKHLMGDLVEVLPVMSLDEIKKLSKETKELVYNLFMFYKKTKTPKVKALLNDNDMKTIKAKKISDSMSSNKKSSYVIDQLMKAGLPHNKAVALAAYHGSMSALRKCKDAKSMLRFKYLKSNITEDEVKKVIDYLSNKKITGKKVATLTDGKLVDSDGNEKPKVGDIVSVNDIWGEIKKIEGNKARVHTGNSGRNVNGKFHPYEFLISFKSMKYTVPQSGRNPFWKVNSKQRPLHVKDSIKVEDSVAIYDGGTIKVGSTTIKEGDKVIIGRGGPWNLEEVKVHQISKEKVVIINEDGKKEEIDLAQFKKAAIS